MTQPAYGTPPGQRPGGNGLAVAGMVCGIVGLVLCFLGIIGMLAALLGVIFGAIGLARSRRVGRGKGAALAGVICGGLGLVAGVVFYVVIINVVEGKFDEAKRDLARATVKKVANEWFARWAIRSSDRACPTDLEEVAREVSASSHELVDPWGQPLQFRCGDDLPAGARGIAVYSIGQNGKDEGGAGDDIKSW